MTPPTPISESDIDRLIPEFYSRIRVEPVLGPIFNAAISDWPEHLETLKSFWSSIILGSGRYKGRPMVQHLLHHDKMTIANFERWLALWRQTTNELLHADQATALQAKAERIAESLRLGVEFRRDKASLS
jgi:hemoglobin